MADKIRFMCWALLLWVPPPACGILFLWQASDGDPRLWYLVALLAVPVATAVLPVVRARKRDEV